MDVSVIVTAACKRITNLELRTHFNDECGSLYTVNRGTESLNLHQLLEECLLSILNPPNKLLSESLRKSTVNVHLPNRIRIFSSPEKHITILLLCPSLAKYAAATAIICLHQG